MQIVNFLITALVNIGIAFVLFFMLIVGLNGYSGNQAEPGLVLYIVWALFFSFLTAGLSVLAARYLIGKKSMNSVAAVAICSPIFMIIGGIACFLGTIAAVILIEALR